MTEAISAYPLQWPAGWDRCDEACRVGARFSKKGSNSYGYQTNKKLSVADAVSRVLESLERMGVDTWNDTVISTDLKLRLDGLPRSNQVMPDDPGACVYWVTAFGERRCMAIDRYDRIADNLAAIAATLEAMRAIERHGGAEILDRAFTGFVALPAPEADPWWSVLGFHDEAEALFQGDYEIRAKKLMQRHHPDKEDGDEWRFKQIVKARDKGREVRDTDRQTLDK